MRISDWSSDVCSSDLGGVLDSARAEPATGRPARPRFCRKAVRGTRHGRGHECALGHGEGWKPQAPRACHVVDARGRAGRSEEHTSELQSLMRISYAVFGLKKQTENQIVITQHK